MTSEHSESEDTEEQQDSQPVHPLRQESDRVELAERPYNVYECGECNNVVLTLRPTDNSMECHGEEMTEITELETDINPPELRQVLLDVFGLPKAGLDICLCVIDEGPLAVDEVASMLGYERSTVTKYLNELVEFGLLEKNQLNREEGGFVNVYHSIDMTEMCREILVGFYVWAGETASLIEQADVTKEEYIDAGNLDDLERVFWENLRDDT